MLIIGHSRRTVRRASLSLTTMLAATALCGILAAAPASAQLVSPAPVRQSVDGNGVDLFLGTLNVTAPAVTMGQGDTQGLSYYQLNRGGGWTDNLTAALNQSGSVSERTSMFGSVTTMLMAAGQVAAAQSVAPSSTILSPPCRIIDARHGQGAAELYAACRSVSVRLGSAESFASSLHLVTGKTVVVCQSGMRTDVLLVSQDASGVPIIQDVSRDVARATSIAGLAYDIRPTIDLTRFATTGVVVLAATGAGAVTKTTSVDLSARLRTGP